MKNNKSSLPHVLQIANEAADFFIVNFLFLATCIPIFTIGTAMASLHQTLFSYILTGDGDARFYLKCFRENFKPFTPIFLMVLFFFTFFAYDLYLTLTHTFPGTALVVVVLMMFLMAGLMVTSHIYLLQARFSVSRRQLVVNSIFIAFAHPLRSMLVILLQWFPIFLLFLGPYYFIMLSPLFLLVYFTLMSYFCVQLVIPIYSKYQPEDQEDEKDGSGEQPPPHGGQ